MVISDGAPGLIGAIETTFPAALRQRCAIHRARNILAKVSARDQPAVKAAYWSILDDIEAAPGEPAIAVARSRAAEFSLRFARAYPAAVACLEEDLASLTTHLRLPAERWHRTRHTNFIERTFGETRRRVKVIGRLPGERWCVSLVWAVLDRASRGLARGDPDPGRASAAAGPAPPAAGVAHHRPRGGRPGRRVVFIQEPASVPDLHRRRDATAAHPAASTPTRIGTADPGMAAPSWQSMMGMTGGSGRAGRLRSWLGLRLSVWTAAQLFLMAVGVAMVVLFFVRPFDPPLRLSAGDAASGYPQAAPAPTSSDPRETTQTQTTTERITITRGVPSLPPRKLDGGGKSNPGRAREIERGTVVVVGPAAAADSTASDAPERSGAVCCAPRERARRNLEGPLRGGPRSWA